MPSCRIDLIGLFAMLLALMAQLGIGASVPRIDPITAARVPCHVEDDPGGKPSQRPAHPSDCLLCPLCAALHSQASVLVSAGPILTPPATLVLARNEPAPPPHAPPAGRWRPPSQQRAPPIS